MAPEILAGAAGLAAAAAVGCAGAAAVVGLAAGGAVGAAAGAVVALAGAAGCVLVAPPHAALSKTALAPSALIRNSRRVFICSTYQQPPCGGRHVVERIVYQCDCWRERSSAKINRMTRS